MKVLNREMKYETVMANYWPTGPDNNTELEEQYAPMTGIMINMKDVVDILKPTTAESDSLVDIIKFHEQIKCTDSLIDMDSYWTLQKSPTQRMMIFLPSKTFICINRLSLQKNVSTG